MKKTVVIAALALLLPYGSDAAAASNIDPRDSGQRYGWTENGGWLNLQGDPTTGVHVGLQTLQGLAWHENFGWINFGGGAPPGNNYSNTSATDFGVNIDASGQLSGYAWGENVGWIAFDTSATGGSRVTIQQPVGRFAGYAWGENVGWISFDTVDVANVAHVAGNSAARDWNLY